MAFIYPPPRITNTAPTANDDGTKGYLPGYWWFDTSANAVYWCESNATGAAVWNASGISAHTALSALAWPTAGHTASTTVSQAAGFTSAGVANLQRFILNPARRLIGWSMVLAGQNGRTNYGLATVSTFGTPGGVANTQLQNWTASAATTGQRFGIYNNTASNATVKLSSNVEFDISVKTGPDISSQRLWIIFATAAPTDANGDDLGTAGLSAIGLRYSTSATDTNWMLYTANGVSQTATSTGVAVATDTLYTFQFRSSSSGIAVSVNGNAEVSVATTLPSTSTMLGIAFIGILQANSNREWNLGNFYIDSGSPGVWP
jgi:hypothetical protein